MDPVTRLLMQGAAGAAGGGGLGIEDVFSTWLYTGNGSTQTITNGIDLSGEGGLVWIKKRSATGNNIFTDSDRGLTKQLYSDLTLAEDTNATVVTAFNGDGFDLGTSGSVSQNLATYASWTFRKAPGFFDVVTYTGDGTFSQQVAHNLGSEPRFIIAKSTSSVTNWYVYHYDGSTRRTQFSLNSTNASGGTSSGGMTSTYFTPGNVRDHTASSPVGNGTTYVAYLFAHDEQIFGDTGDQSVIKCGSYTGTGSDPTIDLGWEPQWLLIKPSSATGSWMLYDTMRGIVNGGDECRLYPNLSNAEECSDNALSLTPTGFQALSGAVDTSGVTYIYIAIRRGPMKTPTDATEVFNAVSFTGDGSTTRIIGSGFPDDLFMIRAPQVDGVNTSVVDRIRGKTKELRTNATSAETDASPNFWAAFDTQSGVNIYNINGFNSSGRSQITYHFRRAPGFFDVVAYTGTGANQSISHNLGVAPELLICKVRSTSDAWFIYAAPLGADKQIRFDTNGAGNATVAVWQQTTPTSTQFFVGTETGVNRSANTFIAYLFATLPGISKVFSYTGTGTTQQIDCGFTSGARFVLIKRTDSTGDWYVYDTARGISSSTDPYLLLNSTAAEVTGTDYIDPYSAGFEISSTAPAAINASGGSFIGLAIA